MNEQVIDSTEDVTEEVDVEGLLFDPLEESTGAAVVGEYDLVSTPNDFNVLTIKNFLDTGAVKVPRYQRNFVWDRARASKLIESLILGLPVPQVFLYEEARNSFQIIDGQQRLMSIYFFLVGRFPRKTAKPRLREFWGQQGGIPPHILSDDGLFESFRLHLPSPQNGPSNPLHGLKYDTLEERQIQLGMRTLRNIVIKQVNPDGRGAVYEIFNRLNTTGVNLTAQEIRMSLADSAFMEQIVEFNMDPVWRQLFGVATPDPRLRDIEVLLRAFAMADESDEYRPSMVRFLDRYADRTRLFKQEQIRPRRMALERFLEDTRHVDRAAFLISERFSVPIFEAIFAAYAQECEKGGQPTLRDDVLARLKVDPEFVDATETHTTDTKNILQRVAVARAYLRGEK
ncbi:DUF262 domain-containing protein [Arthrobacter ramosus]|uniref:DUF262 domain-containing protein n=1 Tax=Arthrobacter ramosus TaxID=1672 RepID=A0ABV5XZ74_ARTRM|nr:DUF262 domain-containing protein [Arthrobacter ramosus]